MASFLALLAGTAIAFKYLPAPFIWILLAWGLALCAWGVLNRQATRGVVVFNLACVILVLAGVEIWLTVAASNQIPIKTVNSPDYIQRHSYLGTRPRPSSVNRATSTYGDLLLYDVEYTIGENGLRISPPVSAGEADGCVLFFGGSFVYGVGVGDAEALPYQVGVEMTGRYATHNFGFHGHGPGQMLAALERGFVDQVIDCEPTHVIYLAIRDHVQRLVGGGWRSFGPKYVTDGNGGVEYAGVIRDAAPTGWLTGSGGYRLRRSKMASRVLDMLQTPGEGDLDLFAAVVRQAVQTVDTNYPGSQFHMLLWDTWGPEDSGVGELEQFSGMMDGVHLASEILPQFRSQPLSYRIHEVDPHPNAAAFELLAAYIATEILDRKS
jgi:hypothetical protein